LIARLVFGTREIIAIAGNSVKLFKGHYTRLPNQNSANGTFIEHTDPSSITGLAYRIAVDRRRVPW
jgi:hypothetical protein